MSDMVQIARKLRHEENFRGYIHLKTIPDAAPELIAEAGLLADRLSINVELPTDAAVAQLAPEKNPAQIRKAMGDVRQRKEEAGERSHTGKHPPRFAPAGQSKPALPEDASEHLWLTYFRNIFNPARLKVKAMQSEMPKKYWKNMPEAAAIPDLIASAPERVRRMNEAAPTLPPVRAAKVQAQRPAQSRKWDAP